VSLRPSKVYPERGDVFPLLSERRNIVFIADEAHRSQYGFAPQSSTRYAAILPMALPSTWRRAANASFIAYGTPVEATDRSTPAVFGDYIDIYDIQRAVEDGATVRIYYKRLPSSIARRRASQD